MDTFMKTIDIENPRIEYPPGMDQSRRRSAWKKRSSAFIIQYKTD
jgi:hypothetical protein